MQEIYDSAEENAVWLRIFQPPGHAPELNPAEGIWSLIERLPADFAAVGFRHLTRVIKRKLRKIPFRLHLIDCCLTGTGLPIEPP